jgi:hypothetical protein
MRKFHRVLIPIALLALAQIAASTGWADDDARADRLRTRGDRAEERLDRKGERQNRKLDRAGDRAERRAERAAQRIER